MVIASPKGVAISFLNIVKHTMKFFEDIAEPVPSILKDCFVAKAPRNDSFLAIILTARDLIPRNDEFSIYTMEVEASCLLAMTFFCRS